MEKEAKLSEAIAGSYQLQGLKPGLVGWKGREYDLRTISLEKAEALVKEGFPNLKKKDKSSAAQKT